MARAVSASTKRQTTRTRRCRRSATKSHPASTTCPTCRGGRLEATRPPCPACSKTLPTTWAERTRTLRSSSTRVAGATRSSRSTVSSGSSGGFGPPSTPCWSSSTPTPLELWSQVPCLWSAKSGRTSLPETQVRTCLLYFPTFVFLIV